MKTRILAPLMFALTLPYVVAAEGRRAGVDFEAETSLNQAVDQFNQQVNRISDIGPQEPSLTTDEVVAAIRAWDRKSTPVEPELFAVFQHIAESKKLPAGSQLDFTTSWKTDEFNYMVWWVDLSVSVPNPEDATSKVGYTFRIRDRKLSSRPLNDRERAEVGTKRSLSIAQQQRHIARHLTGFVTGKAD